MTVLQDIGTFFVYFAEDFIRDVMDNGGNVLTAAVQASVEAAQKAFAGQKGAGADKKAFAFSNTIAALEAKGVKTSEDTISHTVNGLIEISVAKLNKAIGISAVAAAPIADAGVAQ